MSKKPPCYNCKERTPECHSRCEKYSDWASMVKKCNDEARRIKNPVMVEYEAARQIRREKK